MKDLNALRTIDEYRRWLGSHEFPEVARVLDNLYAELNGEGLNAGTPRESDNCVISSLRDQLRNRRAASAPAAQGVDAEAMAKEAHQRGYDNRQSGAFFCGVEWAEGQLATPPAEKQAAPSGEDKA